MADVKRKVVRVDPSPTNPKIKCAELECGHEVFLNRAPAVGKKVACERCTKNKEGPPSKSQRRPCFVCNGTGDICDECGESVDVCDCAEEDKQSSPCSDCSGIGIAWVDLTDEEKKR